MCDVPPVKSHFDLGDFLQFQRLQRGIVRIVGVIDEESITPVLDALLYVEQIGLTRLELHIHSGGGDCYYAFGIYDAVKRLESLGVKTSALCIGGTFSAAAMIVLQACEVRRSLPNCRFLVHEIRRTVKGGTERKTETEDDVKETRALQQRLWQVLAKRTGKTVDDIVRKVERHEVYFSAEEAKGWGLIDEIVGGSV